MILSLLVLSMASYEDVVLARLRQMTETLGVKIIDARGTLRSCSSCTQFKTRSVGGLKGMAFHQQMGDGDIPSIADWHVEHRNWESASYTWAVDKNGDIWLLHDFDVQTISHGKGNKHYVAVVFRGDFPAPGHTGVREPHEVQLISGAVLWYTMAGLFGWERSEIKGHCDLHDKPACPGNTLYALIGQLQGVPVPQHETLHPTAPVRSVPAYRRPVAASPTVPVFPPATPKPIVPSRIPTGAREIVQEYPEAADPNRKLVPVVLGLVGLAGLLLID